jgi:hypothetical protein
MCVSQPELPIDPPTERDFEPPESLAKAQKCRRQMESVGIELAEDNLLTAEEDKLWECSLAVFDKLLCAAEERVK